MKGNRTKGEHIHSARDTTQSLSGDRIVKPRLEGAAVAAGNGRWSHRCERHQASILKSLWLLSGEWSEEGTGAGWLWVPWNWEHSEICLGGWKPRNPRALVQCGQRKRDNLQRRPLGSRKNYKAWPVFTGVLLVSSIRNLKVSEADTRVRRLDMVSHELLVSSPGGVWVSEQEDNLPKILAGALWEENRLLEIQILVCLPDCS